MIKWQLSKQGIRWPVSADRIAGSCVAHRGRNMLCLCHYRVFSLTWPSSMQIYWNNRKRLHEKRVEIPEDWFGTPTWPPFHCFGTPIWLPWRHVKTLYSLALLRFWFQTDLGRNHSASYLKILAGKTFLNMVTRLSHSTSSFHALIGQNLKGEFMWKIYGASWNLFTLTAEADRVLN